MTASDYIRHPGLALIEARSGWWQQCERALKLGRRDLAVAHFRYTLRGSRSVLIEHTAALRAELDALIAERSAIGSADDVGSGS